MSAAEELWALVREAHFRAALDNQNASSVAVMSAASVGAPFSQAVAGALATLGGLHAPVTQARKVIYGRRDWRTLDKVPGWGNSFYKGKVDPAWEHVSAYVAQAIADLDRFYVIGASLEETKRLYPNAAAFTAICAHNLDLPWGTESRLFIEARLPAWAELWAQWRRG